MRRYYRDRVEWYAYYGITLPVYFELDRGSPHWQLMQNSGGFAIHVSGDFPNLRLELWAIRG